MSKNKKRTPFKDFERPTDNEYQVNYMRITHLQLVCMNELTNSAFRLYIMMKDYAKSDTEFTYPHSIFKNIFSNQGFINARTELIEKGYLETFVSHKSVRKENKYRFSSKWRERNQDMIREIVKRERDNPPKRE